MLSTTARSRFAIEIVLAGGDRVVVGNDVNEAALARVVAVLVRR
jgi:hypothetical protein